MGLSQRACWPGRPASVGRKPWSRQSLRAEAKKADLGSSDTALIKRQIMGTEAQEKMPESHLPPSFCEITCPPSPYPIFLVPLLCPQWETGRPTCALDLILPIRSGAHKE